MPLIKCVEIDATSVPEGTPCRAMRYRCSCGSEEFIVFVPSTDNRLHLQCSHCGTSFKVLKLARFKTKAAPP